MFTLRPYQKRLVDEARNLIAQGCKGVCIQSPPGSGKSVIIAEITRLATEKGGHVLFLAHRRELLENIREVFKKNDVDMEKVTISTPVRVLNRLEQLKQPNLIITDESHHSKSKTYQKIYDVFPNVPRLGFTATPWRMNGEGFEGIYDEIVRGPTIKWLIDNHCLAPFRWFSQPLIDRSKVNFQSIKKADASTALQFSDAEIQGDLVKHYRKYADGEQAILYAPTIEASKNFVKTFVDEGINAIHVDSKTPTSERDEIMKDFKDGKIQILSNVDLISEGFNVPDCSCVIMCRPTKSVVLHLQQSMRCMRYQPGKQATILDHVGNGINLGILTDPIFETWEIKARKRKSLTNDDEELSIRVCQTCGQTTLKEDWIDNKCPNCGVVIEIKEKKREKEIDKSVELQELKETHMIASQKMKAGNSLKKNVEIARAKAKVDKKNPLYKFFGNLTIHQHKQFTNEELQEIAQLFDKSIGSVRNVYHWALKKAKENKKKKNVLTVR